MGRVSEAELVELAEIRKREHPQEQQVGAAPEKPACTVCGKAIAGACDRQGVTEPDGSFHFEHIECFLGKRRPPVLKDRQEGSTPEIGIYPCSVCNLPVNVFNDSHAVTSAGVRHTRCCYESQGTLK